VGREAGARARADEVPDGAGTRAEALGEGITVLMLDLDGTLLDLDHRAFYERYFEAIGRFFSDVVSAETFVRDVVASTRAMIGNVDPAVTNRDAFVSDFFARTGLDLDEILPRFDEFYEREFPALRGGAGPSPGAARVVEAARARGLMLVLATSPVFPAVAILERMKWAELDPTWFSLITSFEFMHYCKPHRQYFEEIADLIDRDPRECLMVGNNGKDDMPAGLIGMKTYFVMDGARYERNLACTPDGAGTLSELALILEAGGRAVVDGRPWSEGGEGR